MPDKSAQAMYPMMDKTCFTNLPSADDRVDSPRTYRNPLRDGFPPSPSLDRQICACGYLCAFQMKIGPRVGTARGRVRGPRARLAQRRLHGAASVPVVFRPGRNAVLIFVCAPLCKRRVAHRLSRKFNTAGDVRPLAPAAAFLPGVSTTQNHSLAKHFCLSMS